MNIEMIKSLVFKVLPVLVTYAVGKGILNQETADQIPALVDWLIVGVVMIPTIIRSIKTHKDKPEVPK